MPSKSKKQHRFMVAVANDPKFAKKAGVSQSVGEEFMKADKKGYRKGGMAHSYPTGGMAHCYPTGGRKKSSAIDGIAKKGKTKGKMVKM